MKKTLLIFWVMVAVMRPAVAQVNVQDSMALVDLYNNTNGPGWVERYSTTWLNGPVNTWEGVLMNGTRVVGIHLEQANLNGTLPLSIGTLTELAELNLMENMLQGEIPETLQSLTKLYLLNLGINQLSGPIPQWIGNFTNLVDLGLLSNNFSGEVPASIGNLQKLYSLDIGGNQLSGEIPYSMGNLPTLSFLLIGGNDFTGSLPTSFNNFNGMIFMGGCRFEGPLPHQWPHTRTVVYLTDNQFTFESLEGINFYGGEYYDQKTLDIVNNNPVLSVNAGGTLSNNTYKWFKNGLPYKTISANPSVTADGPGTYTVEVTNLALPNLTLLSHPLVITSIAPAGSSVNLQDSLALVALYQATAGAQWTKYNNWLTGPAINWEGVEITDGRVTALFLDSAGLSGVIPTSFENLSKLRKISMSGNNITGGSHILGTLENAELINLSNNSISENLPVGIGNLTKLRTLNLANNNYTSTIPASPYWTGFTEMEYINLSQNQLTGSIPASFSHFMNSPIINLSDNRLSGPIPGGLCGKGRWIINNNLFTFQGMECLSFVSQWNSSYANQGNVHIIDDNPVLHVNAGGTLSKNTYHWSRNGESAGSITGDSTLTVSEPGLYRVDVKNAILPELVLHSDSVWIEDILPLTATITTRDSLALVDFYNSTNGNNWTQYTNWFTGPASTWEGVGLTGKRVTSLMLESANLTGTLPESIGNLTELRYLYLNENNIGGALPASLWDLHHLVTMSLYFNQFSGTIPASIGNLQAIEQIDLSVNQLEGSIPAELGNATNLSSLLLVRNKLTSGIPASLGNLNLSELHLSYNQLTGGLPASFANFNDFTVIYLDHNYLTGPVPSELCATKDKVAWALHDNQFTFDGLECLTYYEMLVNQKHLTITNNNPVLSVYAGGTLSNNTYTWYKDNGAAPFAVISGDSTITLTQPGTYWAKVNSSVLEQLTLYTDTVVITSIPNQDPLEFTAQKCGRDVCMSWFAQQDLKHTISHFEVERSSDNNRFRKIDRVKASRKNGRQRYSSRDYLPAWGDNYYRVKQVNKDGTHLYSKVIMVEIPRPVIVYIWPNPADNYIYFKGVDKAQKVTLYSLNGQTIRQWQNVNAYQPLNISSVRRGLYVVKVVHASGEAVQLIIVK